MRGKKTENGLELILLGQGYEGTDRMRDVTAKLKLNTLLAEKMVGKVRDMVRKMSKMEAKGHVDGFFASGGVPYTESRIDPETYIVPFIDTTSLTANEITNINIAVNELRELLAGLIYESEAQAAKYVKAPVLFGHERYLQLTQTDYRDSPTEPLKYLFLIFEDEANPSYHGIPRNLSLEPTAEWLQDFAAFEASFATFEVFYCMLFSPTGSPANSSETAFNPHIIDVIEGNNGYTALKDYNWVAKDNWPEDASGFDTFLAIIDFIYTNIYY